MGRLSETSRTIPIATGDIHGFVRFREDYPEVDLPTVICESTRTPSYRAVICFLYWQELHTPSRFAQIVSRLVYSIPLTTYSRTRPKNSLQNVRE